MPKVILWDGTIKQLMTTAQPPFCCINCGVVLHKNHNFGRFRLLHGFMGISSPSRLVPMISTFFPHASRRDFSLQILLDHLVLRIKALVHWVEANRLNPDWCQMFVDNETGFIRLFAQLSCSYLQDARPQTVLVENPKTLDEKGKLVSSLSQTPWP